MPVGSLSNLLFYNVTFNENASNHLALGNAYRFSRENGEATTAEPVMRDGQRASSLRQMVGRRRLYGQLAAGSGPRNAQVIRSA